MQSVANHSEENRPTEYFFRGSFFFLRCIPILDSAAKEGKTFIFIGTKRQANAIISEEAQKCKSFYVNNRWLGGTLTNWATVQQRVKYLKNLNKKESNGYSIVMK